VKWETKPGDDWRMSPIFEDAGGAWFIFGDVAAGYVELPAGIPGYEPGTRLYIEGAFTVSYTCPICSNTDRKRGLSFRDSSLVIVECMGCKKFLWLEITNGNRAEEQNAKMSKLQRGN